MKHENGQKAGSKGIARRLARGRQHFIVPVYISYSNYRDGVTSVRYCNRLAPFRRHERIQQPRPFMWSTVLQVNLRAILFSYV